MEMLIWIGAGLSVLGLLGIVASAALVMRARAQATSDDELRARLNKLLPVNLGALFLSMIGLMVVVTGFLLG